MLSVILKMLFGNIKSICKTAITHSKILKQKNANIYHYPALNFQNNILRRLRGVLVWVIFFHEKFIRAYHFCKINVNI
ncbi:hypothetical protein C7N43_36715 [Sphingobacteriales bacterium UPWRP_1]|nr:hypothetical protein BVG80_12730 [Sphingobacteriales bacterium TSM_CSM]PSJ71944.1 hypothetical protein C7N43_36715 [Sphingobacteriales bacterium UPWRP_1]